MGAKMAEPSLPLKPRRQRRRSSPRLPWKRGPAAWEIRLRADRIRETLSNCRTQFFSLRKAARIFGISTQPMRDWFRKGDIKRDGPRRQFSKAELFRFLTRLEERAEPYDMESRSERFHVNLRRVPWAFNKLHTAKFVWPKGRTSVTPAELAVLVSCHPSLIRKAITEHRGLGHRPTPGRWRISKNAWSNHFFFTLVTKPRLPSLPTGELISTRDTADHLQTCGMEGINQRGVCKLIKGGHLDGAHRSAAGKKWFVKRQSLEKFRQKFKKAIDTAI